VGFQRTREKIAISAIFFATPAPECRLWLEKELRNVPKPPESTPHSDIDGVHQDEKLNVESALEAGQGAEDLARAKAESKGKPRYSDAEPERNEPRR
jgi:hypothetical protein